MYIKGKINIKLLLELKLLPAERVAKARIL
jgi:hypothetical protein